MGKTTCKRRGFWHREFFLFYRRLPDFTGMAVMALVIKIEGTWVSNWKGDDQFAEFV
jgi:hypothetical protein